MLSAAVKRLSESVRDERELGLVFRQLDYAFGKRRPGQRRTVRLVAVSLPFTTQLEARLTQANTHILILAAGRGSRLGVLGAETPKWLLPIREQTIAEHQLAALSVNGLSAEANGATVGSMRVVTGHAADAIERFLEEGQTGASPLYNEDYARLNNWYSLLVGLRALPEDPTTGVIVVNADLFAPRSWMTSFVADATNSSSEALIAVDLQRQLTDESMKVSARSENGLQLERIGKIGVEQPVGEYVGMLMARGSVLQRLRTMLESFEGRPEAADCWYEHAVGLTAAEGSQWQLWPTPDSNWVEIDDDADYASALALANRA
jgi:choline kinase